MLLAEAPWQNCRGAVAKMQMAPPHSGRAAAAEHHREDAANWGTAAEHLRTRVLAFAAAALTFAASGSCPIEQPSAATTNFGRRNWISPKMVYLCLKLESRKDVQERRHINPFGKR